MRIPRSNVLKKVEIFKDFKLTILSFFSYEWENREVVIPQKEARKPRNLPLKSEKNWRLASKISNTFSSWWRAIQTWTLSIVCQKMKAPNAIPKNDATLTIFFLPEIIKTSNFRLCWISSGNRGFSWLFSPPNKNGFRVQVNFRAMYTTLCWAWAETRRRYRCH